MNKSDKMSNMNNVNKKLKFYIVIVSIFTILSLIFTNVRSSATELLDDNTEIIKADSQDVLTKIENTNMYGEELVVQDSEEDNGIATFSARANAYDGTVINGKSYSSNTYVYRDGKNYTYYRENGANFIRIQRYCFETGKVESVYQNWGNYSVDVVSGYYIKDKVIYHAFYEPQQRAKIRIVGYNTQTETVSFDEQFPVAYDQYKREFCLDNNQNVYFLLNGSTNQQFSLVSYNKSGTLIDNLKNVSAGVNDAINLTGTTKNNKVLFLSIHTYVGISNWWDDYAIKIDNGKFTSQKLYGIRQYGGVDWKYIDASQNYAYTQYGEIFKIDYNAKNEIGISFEIKKAIKVNGSYLSTPYLYTSDDKYLYLGGQKGYLYMVNWKTFEIEKSLTIGENKRITGVYKTSGDKVLIEYYNLSDSKYYALTLNTSTYSQVKQNIEIKQHTSLAYTKAQIKDKYDKLAIVNKTSDLYEQVPSIKSPYKEGSLRAQVKTDTINQINYFRWLAGVGSVKQNDNYMNYSQKGAVILAANRNLTHTPSKPAGMTDDFYTKGYKATSAGIGTSANISMGNWMADSVKDYVDDTSNIQKNVGHRLSILDPKAETVSFGYANSYGVINVFNSNKVKETNQFYSWPSPGYFPIESFATNAMWSIKLPENDYYSSGSRYVVLKANGKQYTSSKDFEMYLDSYNNTYFFDIPTELKNHLTNGSMTIQDGKQVEIEVHGLADNLGNTYVIKYPIKFFSFDPKQQTASNTPTKNGVTYRTHVQNVGWQSYVRNGVMSGTSGKSLRLEGINIKLENCDYSGGITYQTHVQNIGWQNYVKDGAMSGTQGKSLRLEAIRIKLTGDIAKYYDIYYRVHCQNLGWMDWAKNGEDAGTSGYSYRLEGIEIRLVKKGELAPGKTQKPFAQKYVRYQTHVQNIGWQGQVLDGNTSGTSGQSLRLEGIKISLDNPKYDGNIEYRTHVQNIGWQSYVKNGAMSGTQGRSLRLEAIQIRLTGTMAQKYDIYYRVHCQKFGWMGWAKNGASAGSAGYSYRLEAIEICVVEKGQPAPGSTTNCFRSK